MKNNPLTAALRAGALWMCALLSAASIQAQTFVRTPYLQNGSTSAITVRWRTDIATDSVATAPRPGAKSPAPFPVE